MYSQISFENNVLENGIFTELEKEEPLQNDAFMYYPPNELERKEQEFMYYQQNQTSQQNMTDYQETPYNQYQHNTSTEDSTRSTNNNRTTKRLNTPLQTNTHKQQKVDTNTSLLKKLLQTPVTSATQVKSTSTSTSTSTKQTLPTTSIPSTSIPLTSSTFVPKVITPEFMTPEFITPDFTTPDLLENGVINQPQPLPSTSFSLTLLENRQLETRVKQNTHANTPNRATLNRESNTLDRHTLRKIKLYNKFFSLLLQNKKYRDIYLRFMVQNKNYIETDMDMFFQRNNEHTNMKKRLSIFEKIYNQHTSTITEIIFKNNELANVWLDISYHMF